MSPIWGQTKRAQMCTASTHSHAAQSPVNMSCVNHHCGEDKTFGGRSPSSY
ncbi:hypothetical protein [Chlorogloea sp. CCALA 695]|uniref:hypothetical protein n=1 Tax=Chlorogloea sp. CCALA 695 TaxID=2107693 RepID=UPI001304FAEC|nr:hypothetical protein [Chlorogloea sp. CCALA 695]